MLVTRTSAARPLLLAGVNQSPLRGASCLGTRNRRLAAAIGAKPAVGDTGKALFYAPNSSWASNRLAAGWRAT